MLKSIKKIVSPKRVKKAAKQSKPKTVPLWAKKVMKLGEQFAKDNDFLVGDSLEPFVERLGGKIVYLGIYDDWTNALKIKSKNNFTIYIPAYLAPSRQRFVIANQITNYVLYERKISKQKVFKINENINVTECFAAGLMMPAKDFKETHERCDGDIFRIRGRFMMPEYSLELRARSLSLDLKQ